MKKIYIKPKIKKFHKAQLIENSKRKRFYEVHTKFTKIGTLPKRQIIDLKNIQNKPQHPDRLYTFSTIHSPDQLKKLRKLLISENFIFDNITDDQFVYLFTDQFVTFRMVPMKLKISWGISEFIRCLLVFLLGEETIIHKNQVLNCFIDADNNPVKISKHVSERYYSKYEQIKKIMIECNIYNDF
jgi:hypothetical protein